MKYKQNFLIFYTVLFVLLTNVYTPNDSKCALNHWTGTSFVFTEKSALVHKDREINLFWMCICYQSILPIIKNKKHLQNIGRIHTKEL